MNIEIIPAIDIIDGRCVRLSQGDYSRVTSYTASPLDMVRAYADAGVSRVHLVDLDGAKVGHTVNLATLRQLSEADTGVTLEWGGGLKTDNDVKSAFAAGADYAVIGSVAAKEPDKFAGWLERYGSERMVLGADVRDGMVAVSGWLETTALSISALLERFSATGLSQAIVTDISRDGMLQGPSDGLYVDLQDRYPLIDFTVSGGISSVDDIVRLDALGLRRVIVGKAIYEGRITMADLAAMCR